MKKDKYGSRFWDAYCLASENTHGIIRNDIDMINMVVV